MEELFLKRLKKAWLIAYLLQIVPFVRMIGLNGSMTRKEIAPSSDIDFLVITAPKRIWTTRLLVTILTHLTGQRRYGPKIAGRICLNRYQTEDFLEVQPHNLYHARTFSNLVPLFGKEIYPSYQKANQWMTKFNYKVKPAFHLPETERPILLAIQKAGEWILKGRFGDWLEARLKNYQKKRILNDPRTKEAPPGRVRISDRELCFHPKK